MGRSRNQYPEPTGNTCPDIDEVISEISEATENLKKLYETGYKSGYSRPLLEQLRESNKALREWGNEMADRVVELEEGIKEKDDTINELESRISRLEDEIKQLNEQ